MSLYQLCKQYQDNKELVDAYLAGKPVEHFDEMKNLGMSIVVSLAVGAIIWVIALIMLISATSDMPTWAAVIAWIMLLFGPFGGSVITILLVVLTRKQKMMKSQRRK